MDRNQPEVVEIFQAMRKLCDSYPGDRALIGEIGDEDPAVSAKYQGANDALNISFNFNFLWQKFSAKSFRDAAIQHYNAIEALSLKNQPNFTLSNHDQARSATRYGKTL